jgi:hypothetical protein
MFYTTDDVVNAKNCLFTVANGLQIEELPRQVVRKAGENKRRLDTDDLLQLYGVLDVNKVVLPIYVAADLARIPPPVNSAQFEVTRLSSSVDDLRSQLSAMKQQVEQLCNVILPLSSSSSLCGLSSSSSKLHPDVASFNPNVTSLPGPPSTSLTEQPLPVENEASLTWADRAASAVDTEEPFQVVSYRRRHPPVVIGRRASGCSVRSVPRRLVCFVGRLDIETSAEDLTEFLSQAGIKGVRCTKIKPKQDQKYFSAAFRVSCEESSKDIFYNESIWPAGVELRDWIFHPKDGEHNK